MKKKVELPISDPIYTTYHIQGIAGAVLTENPSIRNWYLNEIMVLTCNRNFLYGFSTPWVYVCDSSFRKNPHLEKIVIPMKYLDGQIHYVIRKLIDDGYYVAFDGVDDYYVQGKTWYKERHFHYDGLICGYDQENKTYSMQAYDQSWIYRVFQTPQKCFDAGRKAAFREGRYGDICAIKPTADIVELDPKHICEKLKRYLSTSLDRYPLYVNGPVFGTVVHDYVAMFLNMLRNGTIPHERMDRRVFRMIWEHKKVMLERVLAVEESLGLDHKISGQYEAVVKEADAMRMLYASHFLKQRNSLLPCIRNKLIEVKNSEKEILNAFVSQLEGKLEG